MIDCALSLLLYVFAVFGGVGVWVGGCPLVALLVAARSLYIIYKGIGGGHRRRVRGGSSASGRSGGRCSSWVAGVVHRCGDVGGVFIVGGWWDRCGVVLVVLPDSSGVRGSSVAGGSLSLMGGGWLSRSWVAGCSSVTGGGIGAGCCSWVAGGGGRWSRCRRGRRFCSSWSCRGRGGG